MVNRGEMAERVFNEMGFPDGVLMDATRQNVYDYLNEALDYMMDAHVSYWGHTRETTISVVADTGTYEISDWCLYPLSIWTQGNSPIQITWQHPEDLDRNGQRGTNATSAGPNPADVEWYEDTRSAAASGTDASVADAGTAVTKSTGDDFVAAHVGRMIRFGGEGHLYKVGAVGGVNALTLSKAYAARRSGDDQNNTGSNFSSGTWEIGPPGRVQVRFVPTPSTAVTVYVRYRELHDQLLRDTDSPDYLPRTAQHGLVDYAIMRALDAMGKQAGAAKAEARWNRCVDKLFKRAIDKQAPLKRHGSYASAIYNPRRNPYPYTNGQTWRR
jgi:hypothetical protein